MPDYYWGVPPRENSKMPGFFHCANRAGYSVNHDGVVYDNIGGEFLAPFMHWFQYPCVMVDGKTNSIHRIVAETFIPLPEGCKREKMIVNHKDGNKENPHVDNLEWVTRKENVDHALRTGLIKTNVWILAKDIETGEILEFHSIQSCARHFNANASAIFQYVYSDTTHNVRFGKYLLIRRGQPWPDRTVSSGIKGLPKAVILTNSLTNEQRRVLSLKQAAAILEVHPLTVGRWMKDALAKGQDLVYKGWVVKYDLDKPPAAIPRAQRTPVNSLLRKPVPITVKDLATGHIAILPSTEFLAHQLKVTKNTLQKHLLVNGGVWRNELKVEYIR